MYWLNSQILLRQILSVYQLHSIQQSFLSLPSFELFLKIYSFHWHKRNEKYSNDQFFSVYHLHSIRQSFLSLQMLHCYSQYIIFIGIKRMKNTRMINFFSVCQLPSIQQSFLSSFGFFGKIYSFHWYGRNEKSSNNLVFSIYQLHSIQQSYLPTNSFLSENISFSLVYMEGVKNLRI